MKQTTLLFISLFLSANFLFAQTNFNNGFEKGYQNGYCQDQGIGCIKPNPPIAPIPTVNESSSSYQDGYNRGFKMGMNAQKSSSNSSNRTRYQTSKPTFIEDKMYNPYDNLETAMALANAIRESKARAMEHLKNEEYQESANICFAGLRARPNDYEFMMILGQTYRMYGDKKNALLWLRKSKRLKPNDDNLTQLISSLYAEYTTEIKKSINENEFAIINVYRPKKMMGSMLPVDVLIDGELVAKIHSGGHLQYKVYDLTPKKITIKSAGIATLNIVPKKDKTYYFETNPKFSGFTLEQIISPVPEKKLKKKKYVKKADFIF